MEKIEFNLGYIKTSSWLDKMNAVTKLVMFICWVATAIATFDIRISASMCVIGLAMLFTTKISMSLYRPLLIGMVLFLLFTCSFIFLLEPMQGVWFIESETILIANPWFESYNLTQETAWYLLLLFTRYFATLPIALLFITTTNPSEFACALHRLGLSQEKAYSVALTLRYLPTIIDDFNNCRDAQACRGVDSSSDVPLRQRVMNLLRMIMPVLFNSLDKTDMISNALTLRGFGYMNSRSWYSRKPIASMDFIVMFSMVALLCYTIYSRIISETLIWYPF
ncbi:energy-coupling factor transporter transmembrane component T family protein [Vibrio cyclitrophicus]|uniref:energy-coupling factor transporter transmembrane component T family protein n=1 Tax=Vibrio cyclitrophicus TaxID=47951 RepID=UPI00031D44D9|nr:energy-coupling factor transporter transmembrane component T [Vibrio cyclitrophicus]OEF24934.1 hypothetical protein OA9_16905 [Vibrio cyclitrophicus 1F97]OEF33286.1 hypothetical protein OA7_14480 [Vibrio cyclitrophicus 1F53]OEF43373.1 hypothetical protein OAC_09850 [Vibrio cyclitrophicus 1F273]OEF66700.1 hypothetical protein OAA_08125 [Vibrio cyclitrophicus 1F175]PMH36266.1 hypothetical protein BCU72_08900 [Vibrio cyclitrophicus]